MNQEKKLIIKIIANKPSAKALKNFQKKLLEIQQKDFKNT